MEELELEFSSSPWKDCEAVTEHFGNQKRVWNFIVRSMLEILFGPIDLVLNRHIDLHLICDYKICQVSYFVLFGGGPVTRQKYLNFGSKLRLIQNFPGKFLLKID